VLQTVFLDAGGVLVFPNWVRITRALAAHGVQVDPAALARAEPLAKRQLDNGQTIKATNDAGRGWLYFNLIFEYAGVPLDANVEAALDELHAYHRETNLWEYVPPAVFPALAALRERGLKITIVSNSNG
jgi:FMN phosphatase YigB (HAD superfamily)